MQYLPYLEERFEIEIFPFFDDGYLDRLYSSEQSKENYLSYFTSRIRHAQRIRRPGIVWIEKELLPWIPWIFESALLSKDLTIVLDLDDAVFHRYDLNDSRIIRLLLGQKTDRLMARSSLIFAGNRYLASRAVQAGAQKVKVVPTVIDITTYGVRPVAKNDTKLKMGWVGSPSTWQKYVEPILPLLLESARRNGVKFCAIGSGTRHHSDGVLEVLPWCQSNEVELIRKFDFGIMPLVDDPWSRGKCGYKIIQYMACGVPVIASAVGENLNLVSEGVNGFFAQSDADWDTAIAKLSKSAALRMRLGLVGRKMIEEEYSLQKWAPVVTNFLYETYLESRRGSNE